MKHLRGQRLEQVARHLRAVGASPRSGPAAGEDREGDDHGPALSAQDHAFWEREGYVKVPGAVPQAMLERVKAELFDSIGAREDEPESWYAAFERGAKPGLFSSPAEWAVRSHPKVHRIFSELWGTERLWVSFDNVGIRLPDREGYDGGDGFVHWDLTEAQLRGGPSAAMRVQGVLMLEDTPADGGTFQCVPGFHQIVEEWARGLGSDELCAGGTRPVPPDLTHPSLRGRRHDGGDFELVQVGGKAGDLIVWNSYLPHGNSRNSSDRPRLAQFLTMYPETSDSTFNSNNARYNGRWGGVGGDDTSPAWDHEEERRRRVTIFKLGLHVASFDRGWSPDRPFETEGFGGERRLSQAQPPSLSELGERLLGLQEWPEHVR